MKQPKIVDGILYKREMRVYLSRQAFPPNTLMSRRGRAKDLLFYENLYVLAEPIFKAKMCCYGQGHS